MTTTDLKYKLDHGFIHNWLVAGPLESPIKDIPSNLNSQEKLELIKQGTTPELGITETPVDLGSLGQITQQNPLITWRYYHCREDHYLDLSENYASCQLLRAWAYAQVGLAVDGEIKIEVTTNTPIDLWVNSDHQARFDDYLGATVKSRTITVSVQSGLNDFLFRLGNVGARETICILAVRFQDVSDEDVEIVIPTNIEPLLQTTRENIELVIEQAYLDRYVYGNLWGDRYNRNQSIPLKFATDKEFYGELTVRLQSIKGDIFQEGTNKYGPGGGHEFAKIFPLRNGIHHISIVPPANDYYVRKIRVDRKEIFYVVRTPYSESSYGTYAQRAKEALADAAQRRNESIYCEIAKIVTGQPQTIEQKIFTKVYESIERHEDSSVHDLLGLLGLFYRYRRSKKFPKDIKAPLKSAILKFRFYQDEPGSDVMDFESEAEQIIFHTCEILAGQLYPKTTFLNSEKKGTWHVEHGEKLAVKWLLQHGQFGFSEWDDPSCYEMVLSALSHLVDLSGSDTIRELAAILMDKMFFIMAVNSFKGAFGSTRGRTDTASVLSPRLESTSGIFRLMWGMGNFNESLMGTVSLACCKNYELPEIIQKIGEESPSAFWNREHQGGNPKHPFNPGGVDKVCYRTKDFILSSAQDYHPGERGTTEHIWQATLGPDSIVYVNHPVYMKDDDTHQPNLWRGNGVLPRVVQWGDVLISIHKLASDDWLGFTHAYFPAVTFDEYELKGKWAFARKGEAYIALYATNGYSFIQKGMTAFRELRSPGIENIWVCHMGQKLLDGTFDEFQQKILGINLETDSLSVCFSSLRGDVLSFGWEGPFCVNDQQQDITGFRHFENTYCITELPATQMDIVYQEEGIRLNFA